MLRADVAERTVARFFAGLAATTFLLTFFSSGFDNRLARATLSRFFSGCCSSGFLSYLFGCFLDRFFDRFLR